jgi:uncharacterized membrane protein YdjX (TVP38/TMEM64 family)
MYSSMMEVVSAASGVEHGSASTTLIEVAAAIATSALSFLSKKLMLSVGWSIVDGEERLEQLTEKAEMSKTGSWSRSAFNTSSV